MRPATAYCPACGTRNETIRHDGQERAVCPACGYVSYLDPKTAAVAFILHGNHVLLIQRRHQPGAGKWALPGGFVEFGEDPQHAARREVLEETRLDVSITNLLDVFLVENGVITIAYAGVYQTGAAQAGDDAYALGWFRRDALPELVFRSTIDLCHRWQTGTLSSAWQ